MADTVTILNKNPVMRFEETHVFPLTIDFDLLDAGNVVHHPNYLVLCERARAAALDDVNYPHSEMLQEGMSFALTETHSKYMKPALLGEKLSVLTRCLKFSRATITLEQQLVRVSSNYKTLSGYLQKLPEGFVETPYFWIEMRLVCVKLNPIKAQPIPETLINKLNLKQP
jgi:YbgC/YbaW family acyl-CoA thioester hydrolase